MTAELALPLFRIGVIGRDEPLARSIAAVAGRQGAVVERYGSLGEIGFVGRLSLYSLLVLVPDCHPDRAEDIADTVACLAMPVPVLIVREGGDGPEADEQLPASVVAVVHRSSGEAGVQRTVERILTERISCRRF